MTRSFKLGRFAGIEIGVNWTWFFVFFLVAWSLAVAVFPSQNPGLSDGAYWAMGLIAAALFFVSIVLHELGHALQARRDDVEIEGITLWLFGGVARFKSMYDSPGAEFRIAIAGPLVTVAIAAVLIGLGAAVALPPAVDGVVYWLGYINVILLVFNMLPALPLDGGRVLHSVIWRLRDLNTATRVGTAIGTGFGYFLIGGGVVLLFTTGFGGLWLAVLGWFLTVAAQSEAMQMAARQTLSGLRVRDVMASDPVTVGADADVATFIDEVARNTRFSTYPVVEDGEVAGLLSFRCVTQIPRDRWESTRTADCMIPRERVPVVESGEDAAALFQDLIGSETRRALVIDDGHLSGLVSITDLSRAIQTRAPGERVAEQVAMVSGR